MIITTTPSIEGKTITEYKGVIFSDVIPGVKLIKDFTSGITTFLGGRKNTEADELSASRNYILNDLESRAIQLGANAVVNVTFAYESLGTNNGTLMVSASGTAVVCQ